MVETRSRRKSVAPPAASDAAATTPSTTGRQAASSRRQQAAPAAVAAQGEQAVDYAEVYRQKHLQEKRAEQANFVRRWKARVQLAYHQQAMTWGWYMLEPWETAVWMAILLAVAYLVLSACLVNPDSICRAALATARANLAAQGAKLLPFMR